MRKLLILLFLCFGILVADCGAQTGSPVEQDTGSPVQIVQEDYEELFSYESWVKRIREEENNKPLYVCFFLTAEWCGPCKALKKKLVEVGLAHEVVYIDIDKYPALNTQMNSLNTIPRLVRYKVWLDNGVLRASEKTVLGDPSQFDPEFPSHRRFIRRTIEMNGPTKDQ